MPKKVKPKAGRVDMQDLMTLVKKKAGRNVAHDLTGDQSLRRLRSGSQLAPAGLDSIICKGRVAGIPVGKVTEIAGLESTGKSYMAAQIAANAQKQGKLVVYFDSGISNRPKFFGALWVRFRPPNVRPSIPLSSLFWRTIEELLGATD